MAAGVLQNEPLLTSELAAERPLPRLQRQPSGWWRRDSFLGTSAGLAPAAGGRRCWIRLRDSIFSMLAPDLPSRTSVLRVGSAPRNHHHEPQSPRRLSLNGIVGHQAGDVELGHGSQVEPVECAAMSPAGAGMLPQGRLEHAAGERAKSKRIGGPKLCELGTKAFPPGLPVAAREPGRGELDVGLEFRQRGDDDEVLARHVVTHRLALRLVPEELEQRATVDVEHVKRRPRGPGGRR